jgi:hypothetical protein
VDWTVKRVKKKKEKKKKKEDAPAKAGAVCGVWRNHQQQSSPSLPK